MTKPGEVIYDPQRFARIPASVLLHHDREALAQIAKIARNVFSLPIVLTAIGGNDYIFFDSKTGLPSRKVRHTPFSDFAFLNSKVTVVEDTHSDPRFSSSALVRNAPRARFFASCPIRKPDGETLGSFCLMDSKRRKFTRAEQESFVDFAKLAELKILETNSRVFDAQTNALNYQGFHILAENNLSLSSRSNLDTTLIFFEVELEEARGQGENAMLLRVFADLLREALRSSDLIARIGDNQFVALLNNASLDASEDTAFQLKFFISAYNKRSDKVGDINYRYTLKSFDPERHQDIYQCMREFA